ncbi:helicase associated domain-containing protein, partial [bacterium]|nr:helicase associated domain-containing protein [bacterium]
ASKGAGKGAGASAGGDAGGGADGGNDSQEQLQRQLLQNAQWMNKLNIFKAYVLVHGQAPPIDTQSYKWCKRQRAAHRAKQLPESYVKAFAEAGLMSYLTYTRADYSRLIQWMKHFQTFKSHVKEHGYPPQRDSSNYVWLKRQRAAYKINNLAALRVKAFEEADLMQYLTSKSIVPVSQHQAQKTAQKAAQKEQAAAQKQQAAARKARMHQKWTEKLEEVRQFIAQFGRVPTKKSPVFYWFRDTRRLYRRKKMSQVRRDAIESAGLTQFYVDE